MLRDALEFILGPAKGRTRGALLSMRDVWALEATQPASSPAYAGALRIKRPPARELHCMHKNTRLVEPNGGCQASGCDDTG